MIDYYDVLGLTREATEEEIKHAYRKLSIKYLSDDNPNDQEARDDKVKQIAEAYSILSNKDKKQAYDRLDEGPAAAAHAADDNFRAFFGSQDPYKHFFGSQRPGESQQDAPSQLLCGAMMAILFAMWWMGLSFKYLVIVFVTFCYMIGTSGGSSPRQQGSQQDRESSRSDGILGLIFFILWWIGLPINYTLIICVGLFLFTRPSSEQGDSNQQSSQKTNLLGFVFFALWMMGVPFTYAFMPCVILSYFMGPSDTSSSSGEQDDSN